MTKFDEGAVQRAVNLLTCPSPDVHTTAQRKQALKDIAEQIEEANDNCCGCGWPGAVASLLRGEDS